MPTRRALLSSAIALPALHRLYAQTAPRPALDSLLSLFDFETEAFLVLSLLSPEPTFQEGTTRILQTPLT